MESRYKIVITGRTLYKEIELAPNAQQLRVGTGIECDVRLRKDLFFEPVELMFVKRGNAWSVLCSDNLYLTVGKGDIRKLMTKILTHGDFFEVKYQSADNLAFEVDFRIDFDNGKTKYNRAIQIGNNSPVSIGAGSANITLGSSYSKDDHIELIPQKEGFSLNIVKTTYGVYHNGKKAVSGEIIKNGDFLSIADYFFYFKNGVLWTENRRDLTIRALSFYDLPDRNSYPKFNRNTRVKITLNEDSIEILDPPAKPQKPKNNIVTRLLPSMGMMLASGVMAYMGGSMVIMSFISGGMAILTTIITLIESKKEFKKNSESRIEKYTAYIESKRGEIEEYRTAEKEALEEIYVSQETEAERFHTFAPSLFDRTPEDEDYLCVNLGTGAIDARREIKYKKQERLEIEDELQLYPERIGAEYRFVNEAPVVCDLKKVNAIGIVGDKAYCFDLLKNFVIDLVARQYFSDVKMVFAAEPDNKEKIAWLRKLPHVYDEVTKLRTIVTDDESKNIVFEYLYKEMTVREQAKSFAYRIVVFFFDDCSFKSHPISKFVDKAQQLGITFVFFGEKVSDIPLGCGYIIKQAEAGGVLIATANRSESLKFAYPKISDADAKKIVEFLAPVYCEEISLEGTLTKSISMFEMLNILAVDDINLKSRWETSQVFKSMSAPIGVSKTGVVSLDLHDKAHGPHGLVAGTTGSGKSEILQTYILSMSTLYHPYEVGFVIIDFKGGGMVNQFKDLPHLLGAITNIDGKEIDRSLKSIKAELQKRQRLFAEAEVNHIDKYIRKYKAGEVSIPLPHLILIVDEFAELKAEQPEFMKELISAARIGRSLGVHLILATQKPSGQVNEQIWSNSRFKLCLKVQSKEDSNEVLKSPLAAEIKEPGRAYLQVGNNEMFELFQSAYSGAPEKMDDTAVKEFTIYSLSSCGKRTPVYVQKRKKAEGANGTQLDAIVEYVANYCQSIGLKRLPNICLPPLPGVLSYPDKLCVSKTGMLVDIGLYDDPANQYQGMFSIDLSSNNVMIIGSSQSGKTNLLQSIIRNVSTKYSPDEAIIYIIDFASMVLKNFEKLNHVGGVVTASEDEKLRNLFKLLNTEIAVRKEKLLAVGVSSFAAYKESGAADMPLILLIVDNLTALKELYFKDDDELMNLCREGLSVGISIVIANAQTAGIGYRYLSNFSSRIALFCNDSSEYSALFDHCSERLAPTPGKCLVEIEKKHYECQIYLAFSGEKEIERVQEIKQYILKTNKKYRGCFARKIPVIPATLTSGYVTEEFSGYMTNRFSIISGLNYATVMPESINLNGLGMLAISGKESSGKHNWVRYCMDMLQTQYAGQSKVYLVDGIAKKLARLKARDNVCNYSMMASDAVTFIKELEAELKKRYDSLIAGDEEILDRSDLLMLILDNPDALQTVSSDSAANTAYKNIIGKYRNMNVCILAVVDNAPISYNSPELLKTIREQHHVMFFDDLGSMKLFDVPMPVARNFKKPIECGDAYYIKEGEYKKLKTPLVPKA